MKSISFFIFALFLLSTLSASAVDVHPRVDHIAPGFELRGLDSKKHKLSDYRGKVVFLNFWATWCLPCREEMPDIEKLSEVMKGKDFAVVAIGLDQGGMSVVKPFIRKNKFSFTVLTDSGGRFVNNAYRLGDKPIPATFIIGKDGIIRDIFYGGHEWASEGYIQYFNELIVE